jgi:hypothetical protein
VEQSIKGLEVAKDCTQGKFPLQENERLVMNLIYTVAFGNPEHYDLVTEWAKSIRESGYKGDLLLLSDKPFEVEGCRTIVCGWMTPSQFWKAAIRTAVDCKTYKKILFLDSDIACPKNPDAFFELEGIQIPCEPIMVRKSGLNPIFLTHEEWEFWADKDGVNAGTLLVPGVLADDFFTAYENTWKGIDWSKKADYWPDTKTYKGQMYDQSVLQAMVVRGGFPVAPSIMPKNFIGFPCLREEKGDTVALHFCGLKHTKDNKREVLNAMKACKGGDLKEICKNLRLLAHPLGIMNEQMEVLIKKFTEYYAYSQARFARLENEIRTMREPVL